MAFNVSLFVILLKLGMRFNKICNPKLNTRGIMNTVGCISSEVGKDTLFDNFYFGHVMQYFSNDSYCL